MCVLLTSFQDDEEWNPYDEEEDEFSAKLFENRSSYHSMYV